MKKNFLALLNEIFAVFNDSSALSRPNLSILLRIQLTQITQHDRCSRSGDAETNNPNKMDFSFITYQTSLKNYQLLQNMLKCIIPKNLCVSTLTIDLNTRDWTCGPIESDNYFVHASRPYIVFGTPLGNQIDSGLINILLEPPKDRHRNLIHHTILFNG